MSTHLMRGLRQLDRIVSDFEIDEHPNKAKHIVDGAIELVKMYRVRRNVKAEARDEIAAALNSIVVGNDYLLAAELNELCDVIGEQTEIVVPHFDVQEPQ